MKTTKNKTQSIVDPVYNLFGIWFLGSLISDRISPDSSLISFQPFIELLFASQTPPTIGRIASFGMMLFDLCFYLPHMLTEQTFSTIVVTVFFLPMPIVWIKQ
jgi:hypothetical protein